MSINNLQGRSVEGRTAATRTGTSDSSPQWTQVRRKTAGIRDEARVLQDDLESLHRSVQDYDLNDRAAIKTRRSHDALLSELSERRGMSWNDIATAARVSLSAVRKWRRGGDCSAKHRTQLATVAAILDLAEEGMIDDPAGWLLTPVLPGFTLRHIDLIASGRPELVLDCALQMKSPRAVLGEFDEDWATKYRPDYDIFVDGDGIRSLQRIEH